MNIAVGFHSAEVLLTCQSTLLLHLPFPLMRVSIVLAASRALGMAAHPFCALGWYQNVFLVLWVRFAHRFKACI